LGQHDVSKAFTKEDDDLPERSGRQRSASGLPPGALNYMTADGARRLRAELTKADAERAPELARVLASATIVEPPTEPPEGAVFGAKVTLRNASGIEESYRIVGVDEVGFEPGGMSWSSPIGKALLGVEPGQRVKLEADGETRAWTVLRVDY
jgi:transcription elongation GreA/GreB family factor